MSGSTDTTYTLGELSDLVAAKDVDLSNVSTSYQSIQADWTASDPSAAAQWHDQFSALHDAYFNGPRAQAESDISDAKGATYVWGSWSDGDGTPDYQAILRVLNPNWPGAYGPGSFQDLEDRLTKAYASLGQTQPTPAPLPQPQYDSGLDPNSWQAYVTGAAAKLGLVKDPPPGTPGTAGAPPLIPSWLKWTGGAALGLLALNTLANVRRAL